MIMIMFSAIPSAILLFSAFFIDPEKDIETSLSKLYEYKSLNSPNQKNYELAVIKENYPS